MCAIIFELLITLYLTTVKLLILQYFPFPYYYLLVKSVIYGTCL